VHVKPISVTVIPPDVLLVTVTDIDIDDPEYDILTAPYTNCPAPEPLAIGAANLLRLGLNVCVPDPSCIDQFHAIVAPKATLVNWLGKPNMLVKMPVA
jgi:hypothetical protein